MKRILAAVCTAVLLTGCGGGPTVVENAESRVSDGEMLRASQNAHLVMQNAQNYCADCNSRGVQLRTGRYSGKLDTAREMTYDGSQGDFDAAMDTYTNGMAKGYYVVMIDNNGVPSVAYWCESDITSMDFSKEPEGDIVIGKWTD